jgi:putative membrane protein
VGVGAVLGLIVLSRVLSWLFHHHHDLAVSLITGFVAGSLVVIWPWKNPVIEMFTKDDGEVKEKIIGFDNWRLPDITNSGDWLAIGIAVVGFIAVWLIEKSGKKTA